MGNMITDTLIDKKYIENKLIELFPNSIIINSKMNLISISKEVKNLLLYEANESKDWSINNLIKSSKRKFTAKIKQLHNQGFFEPTLFELKNKFGGGITVKIAAFYLGLLTDSNDIIVLMVQDLEKIRKYQKILENKITEFNELVYRTSHDLKGPIATMQGLVNISEYESDPDKLKQLFLNLNNHLKVLDNKTSIISSFGENDVTPKISVRKINLAQLEKLSNEIINDIPCADFITLKTYSEPESALFYDYDILIKIIKNLLESLASLKCKTQLKVSYKFIDSKNQLQLIYSIKGIDLPDNFVFKIQQPEILLREAISNKVYQRLYNLKSIITKFHGYMEFNFKTPNTFQYLIYLPKELGYQ